MIEFFSQRLNSMRRIFVVMITFGLLIGLVFPFVVSPFVTWDPDRKLYFRLACLVAGFAVGAFCYYLVKITLYQRNSLLAARKAELEEAKERFSSLTHMAIKSQDWNVSYEDPAIPTCWQALDCTRYACPAFGRENVRCWLMAGTFCGGQVQGRFAQKLGDCSRCQVYMQAVGGNPISEIGENFNSLMLAVREKEDLLAAANEELQNQYGELEELHRQAREMADTDMLTGLRNHAHFQQHLRWEVSRAFETGRPLSLVMLDLDHFKSINDRYGHQKGDETLRRAGKLLRDKLPGNGYAARYGGEEFVIVLPDMTGVEAYDFADGVRESMSGISGEIELPASAVAGSFGVADLPACADGADSLVSAADAALLFAKRKGRNRVAYFRDLSGTELKLGDIDNLQSRLEGASLQTIWALAEAVDTSEDYKGPAYSELAGLAHVMADRLGMETEQAESLALATRLHDIGKVGIPGSVLRKSSKLSPEELDLVHQHPELGQRILQEARQLKDLIAAILYHHERWDGKGYPEQLQGKQIPLMARIVGILDAYRAMRCDRPYRKALSLKQSIEELRRGAGSQFDPELVELFISLVDSGEAREDPLLRAI